MDTMLNCMLNVKPEQVRSFSRSHQSQSNLHRPLALIAPSTIKVVKNSRTLD